MPLAEHFLRRDCAEMLKPCLRFSADARRLIQSYQWPGNIRELENAIARAVILCETEEICPDLLAIDAEPVTFIDADEEGYLPANVSLEDYFQQFVIANQDMMTETELAQKLGISRKALWQKRQRMGLPRERSRKP